MAKLPTYEEMGKKVAEAALNEIYGGKTIKEWIEILVKQKPWDCISRQAAIALAKDICVPTKDGIVYKHRCIDIDEIRELPPIQPEIKTDGDTISRQAVLDLTGKSDWFESSDDYNDFVWAVCNLPAIKPQPKIGEWLRMSDLSEQLDDRYKCSRCGNVVHHTNKMNLYTFNSWCGRCGSDNGRKRGKK